MCGLLAIPVNCVTKRFSQVQLMFITEQLLYCFKYLLDIMMYYAYWVMVSATYFHIADSGKSLLT